TLTCPRKQSQDTLWTPRSHFSILGTRQPLARAWLTPPFCASCWPKLSRHHTTVGQRQKLLTEHLVPLYRQGNGGPPAGGHSHFQMK
ncbi:unnamed protein product, partial [Gulo gulo]